MENYLNYTNQNDQKTNFHCRHEIIHIYSFEQLFILLNAGIINFDLLMTFRIQQV